MVRERPAPKGRVSISPELPQVLDLPIAAGPCAGVGWLKVALRDGAEGADSRQQPHLGASELVRALAQRDALSAATARQGESS